MNNQLSPIELTRSAARLTDKKRRTITEFREFWTNGNADCLFVPVADYLAWKGIRVRCETYPYAFAAKDWTFAYRAIAAANYVHNDGAPLSEEAMAGDTENPFVKVSTAKYLLFDADFLATFFDEAKEMVTNRALGLDV
jgi:hypothetical protein